MPRPLGLAVSCNRADAHVAAGMNETDARAAALGKLGGPGGLERRKDERRDARRTSGLDHRAQDLRLAVRMLDPPGDGRRRCCRSGRSS